MHIMCTSNIVKRENKKLFFHVGVVLVICTCGYAGLVSYTGFNSPFCVIISESMQHNPYYSGINSIDTADVMIIRSPGKYSIQSYVESTLTGYKTFGDYGSVIVYNREEKQN